MLEKLTDPKHVILWEGRIPVRHRYTAGVAGEAFFAALRDRGEFLASRCDACAVTYCPARLFCERCFAELRSDVKVGPRGTLESVSVGHVGVDGEPLDEPLPVALVRLDGADTVLLHFLLGAGEPGPRRGDRVEAVLQPQASRTGSILDVRGFEPVRG